MPSEYDFHIEESEAPRRSNRLLLLTAILTVAAPALFLIAFQLWQIRSMQSRLDALSNGHAAGNSATSKQLSDLQSHVTSLENDLAAMQSKLNQMKQDSDSQIHTLKAETQDLQQRVKRLEIKKR